MRIRNIVLATLILLLGGCRKEEANPLTSPSEHFEAEGLYILGSANDTLVWYFRGSIRSGDTLRTISGISTKPMHVKFLDAGKKQISLTDDDHTLGWVVDDTTIATAFQQGVPWDFRLQGMKSGITNMELQVLHAGHADFRTQRIPVVVQ